MGRVVTGSHCDVALKLMLYTDDGTHTHAHITTHHTHTRLRSEEHQGHKVAPGPPCFLPFPLMIITTLLRRYQGLSPEPRVCTSHTCCMQMI
jgi:hypothetical protein